jgi:hypothetical protein
MSRFLGFDRTDASRRARQPALAACTRHVGRAWKTCFARAAALRRI